MLAGEGGAGGDEVGGRALEDDPAAVVAAAPGLELVEISNFASTYYVGTRVLKPLLARLGGG